MLKKLRTYIEKRVDAGFWKQAENYKLAKFVSIKRGPSAFLLERFTAASLFHTYIRADWHQPPGFVT